MNAQWTVLGVGKFRTWTLKTSDGEALAKIYAGPCYISYLVQDDSREVLFNNTSTKLDEHKLLIREALYSRFKKLEAVFGSGN